MDALAFALSQIGKPHRHHRNCIHNMTVDDQWETHRPTIRGRKATDAEMVQLGFDKARLYQITPAEWEIDGVS